MARRHAVQHLQLVKRLLPSCEGDTQTAKRQLQWLKDKIVADRARPRSDRSLDDGEWRQLETYVDQRVYDHKPLQYILGTQPFYDLDLLTRPPTLIPRWETEEWTARLVEMVSGPLKRDQQIKAKRKRILDVCTGSGCIALALAAHLPRESADVMGIDIASEAIALARANLARHASQLMCHVEFQQQDVYDAAWVAAHVPSFDMVVSNPPYVTHDEYAHLDADVKLWEDKHALIAADEHGMHLHRHLIDAVAQYMPRRKDHAPLPRLVMEIGGTHQVAPLTQNLNDRQFENVTVWNDLAGRARVILAS
ncbi:S-adenosyl-L-methionine-dependent methyltransferase [Gongronella butleri]|nr:S-adenosyl-L-methionine-dependent methyltransferase [Gongronella butleri]